MLLLLCRWKSLNVCFLACTREKLVHRELFVNCGEMWRKNSVTKKLLERFKFVELKLKNSWEFCGKRIFCDFSPHISVKNVHTAKVEEVESGIFPYGTEYRIVLLSGIFTFSAIQRCFKQSVENFVDKNFISHIL